MAGQAPAARGDRALLRALRILARAGGTAAVDEEGGVTLALPAGGVPRRYAVPAAVLARGVGADLVAVASGVASLTDAGRAWLVRAGEPDAPFLAQHRTLARRAVETPSGQAEVLVDEEESPLAWLRRRRDPRGRSLIDDEAFRAGERLRADFTRGNLTPRVTAHWEAAVSSGRRAQPDGPEFSDVVVAARQRVARAMEAVGPELSGVLLDVCCFLKGLEQVEQERHWPARSAKVVLSIALARLARHYGIGGAARGPERSAMRMWGAEDYRPSLAGRGKPSR